MGVGVGPAHEEGHPRLSQELQGPGSRGELRGLSLHLGQGWVRVPPVAAALVSCPRMADKVGTMPGVPSGSQEGRRAGRRWAGSTVKDSPVAHSAPRQLQGELGEHLAGPRLNAHVRQLGAATLADVDHADGHVALGGAEDEAVAGEDRQG